MFPLSSRCNCLMNTLGTLSKDVFERRTSTGSEAFSLSICLDANKLVLLSFFSLLKTIYLRVSTKPLPNDAKSPLPVDVRRSKTLLLKLPNNAFGKLCSRLQKKLPDRGKQLLSRALISNKFVQSQGRNYGN